MCRRSLALLLLAAAVGSAAAAEPEPSAASRPTPASASAPLPVLSPVWLDLVANEVPKGTLLVYLSPGDVWVDAADLAQSGLAITGGERVERAGRSLVSLASLAPDVRFTVDEAALALRLTASAPLLARSRLDLATVRRPAGLLRREGSSAYLNWSASADSEAQRSATTELGVAVGPALLVAGASADRTTGVVRGLTTLHVDDPPRLLRYTAGDLYATSVDPLGGAALVLGGAVGRDFGLDPYVLTAPYPRTSLFSATPATLEVWVDDTLVRRTRVQPGTIDLENIPVNAGMSEIRTVLRDPFGREQSASSYALMGSTALAPGLIDWNAAAGARRRRFGYASFDYGSPVGIGRLRAGLTRAITAGARLEGGNGLVSAGASATLVTVLGELEGNVAASRDGGAAGTAAALAWRHSARRTGIVLQLRWDSGRYANAGLPARLDRNVRSAAITGTAALAPHLSVLGEAFAGEARDAGTAWGFTGRAVWSFPRGAYAALSVGRAARAGLPVATEVMVTLSAPFPGRATAELQGASRSDGTRYGQLAINRSLPPGPGVGYRVAARSGDGAFGSAEVEAQNGLGRAELRHQELDPWSGARAPYSFAQVSSGLVLIDGRAFVSRPVEGGFALVDLNGAPGVRVMSEGNVVGRTDRNGELLVTGLVPYQGNRIGIRDEDVPLDYRVDEVERVVAPRERGGAVERFRVARIAAVTGRLSLEIDGRAVSPDWGEVAVELPGRRAVSPVGEGGLFWLEAIPVGTHAALLRWEGRVCRFTFEVPVRVGIVDLGTVRCAQML